MPVQDPGDEKFNPQQYDMNDATNTRNHGFGPHARGIAHGLVISVIALAIAWIFHEPRETETTSGISETARSETIPKPKNISAIPASRVPELRPAAERYLITVVSPEELPKSVTEELAGLLSEQDRIRFIDPRKAGSEFRDCRYPLTLVSTADGREIGRWEGIIPLVEIRKMLAQPSAEMGEHIETVPVPTTGEH